MEIPEAMQEQLEVWQNSPMTKWFFLQIEKERSEHEEEMGLGSTVDLSSVDSTALRTAHENGYISALYYCTRFDFYKEGDNEVDA